MMRLACALAMALMAAAPAAATAVWSSVFSGGEIRILTSGGSGRTHAVYGVALFNEAGRFAGAFEMPDPDWREGVVYDSWTQNLHRVIWDQNATSSATYLRPFITEFWLNDRSYVVDAYPFLFFPPAASPRSVRLAFGRVPQATDWPVPIPLPVPALMLGGALAALVSLRAAGGRRRGLRAD